MFKLNQRLFRTRDDISTYFASYIAENAKDNPVKVDEVITKELLALINSNPPYAKQKFIVNMDHFYIYHDKHNPGVYVKFPNSPYNAMRNYRIDFNRLLCLLPDDFGLTEEDKQQLQIPIGLKSIDKAEIDTKKLIIELIEEQVRAQTEVLNLLKSI